MLMRPYLLASLLVGFSPVARGQFLGPANVTAPSVWLLPEVIGDSLRATVLSNYEDQNGSDLGASSIAVHGGTINSHRFPDQDMANARWMIGDTVSPNGTSVFMISRSIEVDERILWSLEVADTARMVLTTARAADLTMGMHLMNEAGSTAQTKLIGHAHRASKRIDGPSYLRLGHAPGFPVVPTPSFSGAIPEMLFFDRVVSPKEQGRIFSYLAVKYGITLGGEDYVASDQKRVWSHRANESYSHNMIAIARDSAAMLDQRQSTSVNEEGFIVLGHDTLTQWHDEHPQPLPNGHYVVVGDDGKDRTWADRQAGQPQYLKRTWHLERTGAQVLNTQLRLYKAMVLNEPEMDDTYWLFIDRSRDGGFQATTTEVIQAAGVNEGNVDFEDVFWDIDASGSDRFRMAAGGKFIPVTWVEPPTCDPLVMGSLTIRVPGGQAPIHCQLKGIGHDLEFERMVSADTLTTIEGLAPGEYALSISDATGYAILDSLWIEAKDAPQIVWESHYQLKAEEPLVLDASIPGAFVTYEWTLNGEHIGREPRMRIVEPGYYACTASADGCPTRANTQVFTLAPEDGIGIGVMPNPSLNGDFVVQVTLKEGMDAELVIATLQGTLIRQRSLRGAQFHHFVEHLSDAGEYIISVRTRDGQRSTRVIVL